MISQTELNWLRRQYLENIERLSGEFDSDSAMRVETLAECDRASRAFADIARHLGYSLEPISISI